jgi:serine/arginine repetitive matrix protein 2
MYNGVGLTSARGTGTSGYVQKNLSYVKAQQVVRRTEHAHLAERFEKDEEQRRALNSSVGAAPDAAIVKHELKRRVELKVAELREKLTQGVYMRKRTTLSSGSGSSSSSSSSSSSDVLTVDEENEIEEKVNQVRTKLLAELLNQQESSSRSSKTEGAGLNNQAAFVAPSQKKESDLLKVKAAIGILDSYVPGQAFDKVKQEQLKLERLAKREAEERERISIRKEAEDRVKDATPVTSELRPSSANIPSASSNALSDSVKLLLSNATASNIDEKDSLEKDNYHRLQDRDGRGAKSSSRKRSRSRSLSSYSGSSSYSSYTGSRYYSNSGSSRSSFSGSSSDEDEDEGDHHHHHRRRSPSPTRDRVSKSHRRSPSPRNRRRSPSPTNSKSSSSIRNSKSRLKSPTISKSVIEKTDK